MTAKRTDIDLARAAMWEQAFPRVWRVTIVVGVAGFMTLCEINDIQNAHKLEKDARDAAAAAALQAKHVTQAKADARMTLDLTVASPQFAGDAHVTEACATLPDGERSPGQRKTCEQAGQIERARRANVALADVPAFLVSGMSLLRAEVVSALDSANEAESLLDMAKGTSVEKSPDWKRLRKQADQLLKGALRLRHQKDIELKKLEDAKQFAIVQQGAGARAAYAAQLENHAVHHGMDLYVRASGRAGTTLWIQYILCNRPFLAELLDGTRDSIFSDLEAASNVDTLRKLGFKRVACFDGYEEGVSANL